MTGRLGPWLIAAVVAAALVFALVTGSSTPPLLTRGSVAPDFALPPLDGGAPVRLAELRGRIVLVNFWATWCKPCEDEMPAMERLHRALDPEHFALLAISVDDAPDLVTAFSDRLGLSFPILLDPGRVVSTEWQTFRYPESFLIGRDGTVVERYIGPREWDAPAYVERIRRLLANGSG
jgi:peroxiredoxin